MLSRLAVVGALVLGFSATIVAQQSSSLGAYTDEDAYRVYDALLPQDSSASTLAIQAETNARVSDPESHSWGPDECIDASVAGEFKEAIEDYNRLNRSKWLLQRKFSIQRRYEILDSATRNALFKDGWKEFEQRFPHSGGVFEMSAVGFDKHRTRAVVYFGHLCGNLCGEWSFQLLKKVDGKWQNVPGVNCHTVS